MNPQLPPVGYEPDYRRSPIRQVRAAPPPGQFLGPGGKKLHRLAARWFVWGFPLPYTASRAADSKIRRKKRESFFVQTCTKQELPQDFNPATMGSAKSKSAAMNDSVPWSD